MAKVQSFTWVFVTAVDVHRSVVGLKPWVESGKGHWKSAVHGLEEL
jgi:hypothetical protein